MAYVNDSETADVITFQRVQMRGQRRASLNETGAYGALPYIAPEMPAEITHPFTLMTPCNVQQRLVTAGKLPRSGVDGQWGNQSHLALNEFAKQLPLDVARSVMPTGTSALPGFGAREDYRADGNKIRIPQAYATALPAAALVACGVPRAADPGNLPEQSDDTVAYSPVKSAIPWAMIGLGTLGVVIVVGVLVSTSKKSTR